MTQPIATIVAALVAAFMGSWLGAFAALSRFRRERAFDRQLDWYERMIRAAYSFAEKIEIAVTFHRDPTTARDHLQHLWQEVQKAHLSLDRTALEAALYGSSQAIQVAKRIARKAQAVADDTDAFDPTSLSGDALDQRVERIEGLAPILHQQAEPLALEARRHLGLAGR